MKARASHHLATVCFSPLSFQIASSLSKELCALVFGINTFLATVLKTVITLVVSDKRGLGLSVLRQVSPTFILTLGGGNPLCGHSKASWHPRSVIPSQGAQIHRHGSDTEHGPHRSREQDCWDRLTFPGALDVARLATFIYPRASTLLLSRLDLAPKWLDLQG